MALIPEEKVEAPEFLPVISHSFCLPVAMELILSKVEAWSWGNYNVTDGVGKLVFKVEGRLSLRWTRTIVDSNGKVILRMHKKLLTPDVMEGFVDTEDGNRKIFVAKAVMSAGSHFSFHVFFPPSAATDSQQPSFKLEGKFFQNDYEIYHGERLIAKATRKPDASGYVLGCGAYTIKVYPGADHVFVTALVLLMDEIHLEARVRHD